MIKTRGEKVAPRQVEEVIARLPGVAEVAVYGVPDDVLGEAVAAVVTLTPGASLTARARSTLLPRAPRSVHGPENRGHPAMRCRPR